MSPRRFNQHAAGRGAKYFRGRQPKQLVYIEPGHNRSSATKREIDLKKLSREEKSRIITSDMNKLGIFVLSFLALDICEFMDQPGWCISQIR